MLSSRNKKIQTVSLWAVYVIVDSISAQWQKDLSLKVCILDVQLMIFGISLLKSRKYYSYYDEVN